MADGKTQWGLKKMGFSLLTKADKKITAFGEIHVQVGAITVNITNDDSNNNRQAADDGIHFDGSGASTATIEITCAKFDKFYRTNILGWFEDGGGLGRGKGAKKEFCFLGETNTDQGSKRFLFYDCTSSDINESYQSNDVDGNYTFAEESVTLTAKMVELPSDIERLYWECENDAPEYAGFWSEVYYLEPETQTEPTEPVEP
jgi:hypothetical protein